MEIYAGLTIMTAALLGFAVSLLTFSGAWLVVAVAGGFWFLHPELYWWPTFAVGVLCALCGELVELIGSAVGVKRLGGGRSGMLGSIVGLIVGLILGTVLIPVPVVGSLVGGIIGAGVGALLAERGVAGRTWGRSARIGVGAAAGRGVSMIVKSGLTAVCGVILTVGAFV